MDDTHRDAMAALLSPRSVAVIGATEREGASSSYVMKNLFAHGFAGAIVPVNPKGGTIFGRTAVPSIRSHKVDVAVIGIAAEQVNAALEEVAEAGIRAAVVLASGFAEADEVGRQRQAAMVALAQRHQMVICGPNCLGLVNLQSGAALYSSTLSRNVRKGPLALISQSGASAIALSNTGQLGLSKVISSGNSAVTDIPEYLAWLAEDEATRVIGVVMEGLRDPAAFSTAMQAVQSAGKPVIVLRAGRSDRGQRATAAHTGALAGSEAAYRSMFRRTGVIEVGDMDEFIQTAALCSGLRAAPRKRGVAVIGVSGGGVAHVADIAEEAGLDLPAFAPDTLTRLACLLPRFATPQNPLDTTGIVFGDAAIYTSVLEAVAADPSVGIVVAAQDVPVGLDAAGAAEYLGIVGAIADFTAHSPTPAVLMSNLSSGLHPAARQRGETGTIVLNGTRAALRAIGHVLPHIEPGQPSGVSLGAESDPGEASAPEAPRALTEREAKAFLSVHGLRVTRERLATTEAAAVAAAQAIGFPVALKIESPDLPHKTEAGGVLLNVGSAEGVRVGFSQIIASAKAFAPAADLRGVVVQEMIPNGVEVLIGLSRHDPFGLGMVVGVGGTLVELVADTAFELLPIDAKLARDMIARTRLAPLLAGYRGAPPADHQALVEMIVTLSRLAVTEGDGIEAIDLNPVSVLPVGQGVRILDALILPRIGWSGIAKTS